MMGKTALITGITGQDGRHLSELLNEKGYTVYGIMRGQRNPKMEMVKETMPWVKIIEADLADLSSLVRAVSESKPDEVYNLAAISHVGHSFKQPILTAELTGTGVLNMLEAIRLAGFEKTARFYQASTSEMFGGLDYNRPENGYTEESTFHPRSPYGVAKLYGYWITVNYRESYDMFAANGILFNHEGEYRGLEFLPRKVSNAVARIKLGKQTHIELGNMDAKRDWGYAGDYVEGMWRILQQDTPSDFVLATGETHSVREFVELSFKEIGVTLEWRGEGEQEEGINADTGDVLVKINPDFYRPAEVDLLLGNPAHAEKVLGWKRKLDFPALVKQMVEKDLEAESKN
jgi:GDPmannose 4,6-dehydratase